MSRRVVLLILAILIAAGGAVAVFLYVQNVEDAAAADAERVQVLVATQTIPLGQTAGEAESAASFELVDIPQDTAAPGALSSIEPIRDLSALAPIYAGEQILEQKFGTLGSSVPLPIPDGKLAISVQLSDPARVAGFVGPGSEVAIFFTPTPEGQDAEEFTAVLLPRIEVIAAGQTTVVTRVTTTESGTQTTEDIPLAILTLAVDQEQAEQIVQAQTQGELYFGLLTESSETNRDAPTTPDDLVVR